jgi:hypothetical protein
MSLSYGRRSVDQFVLVSDSPLGPSPDFFFILSLVTIALLFSCRAPSLTRGQVCNLQCNRCLVRLLKTNNHTLPSHLRLCSLFVASYDSQGLRWRYSNPPPHEVYQTKTGFHLNNKYKFSSYLTGNTLRLCYKNQPVEAV